MFRQAREISALTTREEDRALDRRVLVAVGLVVLARIVYLALAPVAGLTFRSTDDSYYYFGVARNIVLGNGVTFDGMNPTNGWHPLWMLMLLPIYKLTAASPELALRVVFSLVAVIAGATFWTAYRVLGLWMERLIALLASSLLLAPMFLNAMLNGLETGVLILLMLVTVWHTARHDLFSPRTSWSRDALLGALLGLVFLARLDSAFFVMAFGLVIVGRWARECRRDREMGPAALIRKAVISGGVFLLVAAPYVIWNRMTFGHIVPISGAVKSSFPEIAFRLERLLGFHALYGVMQLAVATVALIVLEIWHFRRPQHYRVPSVLWALWLGAILHFAYSMLFMRWAAHWWHYASYIPLVLLSVGLLLERVRAWLKLPAVAWRLALGGALAVCVAGMWADARLRGEHHEPWLAAALWTRDNLPPDAVVGMMDCGLYGYFNGHRTVNLDGVINGYAFQEALRDGRFSEFLASCGVTHIADYHVNYRDGRFSINVPARLHRAPGAQIVATPDAEVHRSEPYRHVAAKHGETRFVIWKLEGLTIHDQAPPRTTRPGGEG
jgi:hypothetical protein